MTNYTEYQPKNKIRILTATSLFDGHDASINIMRRLLQARGAEVIHLGHNRTAKEVALAAIQEDVQAVALSSYQGGHMEYFTYVRKLLNTHGGERIGIFAGGGGVISLEEKAYLESEKIAWIYTPEEGQQMGLQGIIGHILYTSDFAYTTPHASTMPLDAQQARHLTLLESGTSPMTESLVGTPRWSVPGKDPEGDTPTGCPHRPLETPAASAKPQAPILGITGTGGAGKSSLVDELLLRFLQDFPTVRIAVCCVDPTKKKTGGALLGDRMRINAARNERIFLRSFASRGSGKEISRTCASAIAYLRTQPFDLIVLETSGIGQADTGILDLSDCSLYVMTPEYGASTQLEKIDMLDFADWIAVNKYERPQGEDALQAVQTTLRRSRFQGQPQTSYPVFGTIASRFNDDGTNGLYLSMVAHLQRYGDLWKQKPAFSRLSAPASTQREALIPYHRVHYLSQIAETVRSYSKKTSEQVTLAQQLESLTEARALLADPALQISLDAHIKTVRSQMEPALLQAIETWDSTKATYFEPSFPFLVRGKEIRVPSSFETLSQSVFPKVMPPTYQRKSEIARFLLTENLPGSFPFAAGIFPFRRNEEDPKRQFAGEGGPATTNKRFHFLCKDDVAKRLSTAFDSVTLYGAEPHERPDIFGKVGEAGVSIAHLDDMKRLYEGFDLCDPKTSVSMTINGPAPILLAMFFSVAIDQQVDQFLVQQGRIPNEKEFAEIREKTVQVVRGTVQADILKEDQAQNTCIFSTEFALKMMGDMQTYFVEHQVRNYYSVSISGYHIAEAGANPITQLAFTLANGFTYVEYYLARGLNIDAFAPNLAFFFSNGIDAEYAVLGRVARRVWAIAMRDLYKGNERSQKLKYHIQTSGRSLHAQEMAFNDIRTTLQALMALYDNCNSLHTNAYDEALTTPTEESVRRAMAIQLIINREFGLNQCENVNQGSFFIEHLTQFVEEAVLQEFEKISSRGGVLGAMETQYQRNKIQEESLYYEERKHSGALPLIGVNTYLDPNQGKDGAVRQTTHLIRSSYAEKEEQRQRLIGFKKKNEVQRPEALQRLRQAVIQNRNIFEELLHTVRYCSLGEITDTLFDVGGEYRRSL